MNDADELSRCPRRFNQHFLNLQYAWNVFQEILHRVIDVFHILIIKYQILNRHLFYLT